MNIETKNNCTEIAFSQANEIKIKSVTLWGTKEGLLEFFDQKNMMKTREYFKKRDKNLKSGIFLLIKEDKSFAYIVIWPGKMTYQYQKLDEPQKDLLLSLVRIGLSLSDNSVICLTKIQQNEFDFQALKNINNKWAYKPTIGEVTINKNDYDFFNLNEDIEIEMDSEEINENMNIIKLNGSSIFLSSQLLDNSNVEIYSNTPEQKINFNEENVLIDKNINYRPKSLYNFLRKYSCFSELI